MRVRVYVWLKLKKIIYEIRNGFGIVCCECVCVFLLMHYGVACRRSYVGFVGFIVILLHCRLAAAMMVVM